INALNAVTTALYDPAGRTIASIDALTQRTTTSYDAAGRAISVENPLQDVTTSVYDLAGQAVAMVDSLVQRTTTVYDLAGRPIATINPLLQATTTVYDVAGQTIRVIDANGYSTTTVYNAVGLPISIVDARGYRTTTVYDPAERVTAVVNALNQRTTTLYDVAGQKVASIDPLGQRATNIYDAAGEIIAAINPLGQVVTTVYDEAGRIHAVINPLSERTTTSYDAAGRPIVAQNPLNERATTVYDPLGQTISVIDPLGYRTSTIYDAISQRIASVDPRGYRLTFSYDAARQETRQINALGLITSFSYDKVGQRTRQIDPRGVVTTYVFDPANRLTSRADSLGGRVTWTYDNVANPLVIDGATGPYTRTYDPVNQVVTLITGNGDTLQWLRDPLGRRQVLIDPDNGRTTYSYDAVGRMPRLVNSYDEITSFSYDAAGQEIGQVAANSTATTTIYDPAGRIARVAHLDVLASVVDQFDYSYDAAGRRTRVAEESGDVVTWTYDSTGQLLSEARSGANPYRTTYVYDPSGNRLAEETLAGGRTTSVYDSANRLLRSEALSGITTYTYDLAGNRRSLEEPSGDITTYTWNAQNQLIEVELPDSQVLTYVWAPVNKNGEERQVTRDDGIELNQLLWDNNNVLRETDELGTVTADYTYQPQPYGDLLSDHRDTESSFYWFDALGSTTALTDDTGNTTDEYRYTGFGNPTTTSGTSDTPYRWVGQVGYRQDETTGLSNLRARDYDPQTGQFISQDPLGAGLGDSNFYRYVANQPVNLVDPSGLQPYSHLYTQNSVVYADNGYYFDQLVGDLSNLNGTATVARTTSKGRFEVDLSRVFAFADLYWGTVAPGETNTVWYWGSSDWDRWFEKNGVLQTKPSSPASPFLPPSSNFGGLQDTFSTCATVAQEFDKGLSLGYLNLAVAFTWGQSETLNCLRDDQRAQCYGVSDTDQYISVGAATVAREALLATLSGGAAQAAAKGSTGAKFANAAFYIKDGIDAGQQGLQLLQSKSLKEALLNAGLLVIQVASLKGSTGQVLDDGKALCKQFDGTINIKLMPRKYLKPSLDDLKGLDKNANGIVDPSDFPKESLGSLDGRKIYQAPDGSLWACSEVCEKLVAKANAPSSGRPSAKFTHDEYLQKVRPGAKEKTFYPSGKTQGGLGSRRYDDFDPKTKTGYEANTTPWECITAEKLQAKLHQVGSDILLLRNPRSGVKKVIWFGTEELPTSGPAAQLRTALQQAGIKYEVINP
ncbi:MAG: RHS repeat-associated core domain-containing protein, partial [Planctomycetota bacterium]